MGPDEQVAQELERAAARARQRSGHAAQAALLERAAELSPDPARRAERALAAASAELAGGRAQAAAGLLSAAAGGLAGAAGRARALRLSGAVERALGAESAPATLAAAARALLPHDPAGAVRARLEALEAALWLGRPGELGLIATPAPQPHPAGQPGAPALLLEGLCALYGGRPEAAPAPLRRALQALFVADEPELYGLALLAAGELLDAGALEQVAARWGESARAEGAPAMLAQALIGRAGQVELAQGRLSAAAAALAEARELAAAAARPELVAPARASELLLLCWRGREAQARALVAGPAPAPSGPAAWTQAALAVLELGLGRYQQALEAAERACPPDPAPLLAPALCDLVEAAVRAGAPGRAEAAFRRLCARAGQTGGDWALGLCARARALLCAPGEADEAYREAIERLSYWYWGPRDYTGSTVIVLGSDGDGDREHFKTVEPVGRTYHPYSRRDEHFEIFLCRGLNQHLKTLWPRIKNWG